MINEWTQKNECGEENKIGHLPLGSIMWHLCIPRFYLMLVHKRTLLHRQFWSMCFCFPNRSVVRPGKITCFTRNSLSSLTSVLDIIMLWNQSGPFKVLNYIIWRIVLGLSFVVESKISCCLSSLVTALFSSCRIISAFRITASEAAPALSNPRTSQMKSP